MNKIRIPNHTVAYDDLLYSVFCDAFCHGIKNKKEMIKINVWICLPVNHLLNWGLDRPPGAPGHCLIA